MSSPSPAGAVMPWKRSTLVWMLMMLVETGNGYVREVFVAPRLGAASARQLSLLTGSLLVLSIAWACAGWLRAAHRRQQFQIGVFWAVLTLIFELSLGRALGLSWRELLGQFNPLQGGLAGVALLVMGLAPWITARKS